MTAMLFTLPKQRLFDSNANPLNGGKIYIYDTGTTTPKTTYTDRARTIAHTHPIVADADGYVAPVYPPDGTYKITVTDSADVTQWTADDQQGPLDLSGFSTSGSGITEPVTYVTTTHSQAATDYGTIWACDATGGAFDFNVPSAVSKAGQQFTVLNTGTANRVTVKQYSSELLDGGATIALYPGEKVRLVSDGAQLLRMSDRPAIRPAVRQTVLSGPVGTGGGSAGFPNLFPATAVSLAVTSQNVTSTTPLIVTAANGYDRNGAVDRTGISAANLTWSTLTPSATCYLYIDIGADGVLTTGHTTLQPDYQWGGAYSTTNGQFTYNIQEAIGKVGNGASAVQTYRVYVGEAVTTGSAVGSCVAYSYAGRYLQTFALQAPGTRNSFNHYMGVNPSVPPESEFWLKCVNASAGYSTNQYAKLQGQGNAGYISGTPLSIEDRNTGSFDVSTAYAVFHRTTGVITVVAAADWSAVVKISRGW